MGRSLVGAMFTGIDQGLRLLDVRPDETTVAFLPFFHIYGLNVLMNPFLAAGARIVAFDVLDQQTLAEAGEVADDLVGADVGDDRADRHGDDQVLPGLAIHLPAHAVLAALGAELALVAEVDQGVEVLVGLQPDAAAVAAVAAVRAAQRNELLAAEPHATVAAVTGADLDFCFVYEFHGI